MRRGLAVVYCRLQMILSSSLHRISDLWGDSVGGEGLKEEGESFPVHVGGQLRVCVCVHQRGVHRMSVCVCVCVCVIEEITLYMKVAHTNPGNALMQVCKCKLKPLHVIWELHEFMREQYLAGM